MQSFQTLMGLVLVIKFWLSQSLVPIQSFQTFHRFNRLVIKVAIIGTNAVFSDSQRTYKRTFT